MKKMRFCLEAENCVPALLNLKFQQRTEEDEEWKERLRCFLVLTEHDRALKRRENDEEL
jgi:hypothetical protein